MEIHDHVWVVTGGGDGIGRALVLEILRRGGRVAAVDLRAEGLDETARLAGAGERLTTHVHDVTDREGATALVASVESAHGAVDGLINNAGIIQPFVPVHELGFDAVDRVLDVNLNGPINLIKAFLPALLARPEGYVCNVSSMGGFFPFPGQTVYGASKAAVKLLSEGMYLELLDRGVGVSVVMPGAIATDITGNSGVESPGGITADDAASSRMPMTTPADAAVRILEGIEKDELHIHVGTDARLMDLANRVAPKASAKLVRAQMRKRGIG